MGREKGWVTVSVRTYHSHRSREQQQQQQQQQRVMQQDYTVDETGATLNAVARTASPEEEQQLMDQMQQAAGQTTTSIFIRDWKVRHAPARRAAHPIPMLRRLARTQLSPTMHRARPAGLLHARRLPA